MLSETKEIIRNSQEPQEKLKITNQNRTMTEKAWDETF